MEEKENCAKEKIKEKEKSEEEKEEEKENIEQSVEVERRKEEKEKKEEGCDVAILLEDEVFIEANKGVTSDVTNTVEVCSNKRLSTITEMAATPPSSPGILKKSITVSPALKTRRVSFAEPISQSTICENTIPRSPTASPWRSHKYLKKRVVSRRLSLPAPRRFRPDDAQRSPMSVRSATVAKAIADIRARESELSATNQLSPSTGNKGVPPTQPPVSPVKQGDDVIMAKMCDVIYLSRYSAEQLTEVMQAVVTVLARKVKQK
uniref:Uncharacterized protein n=2 Tax=Ciona intestinalis TaxID=7719 RepID=F6VTD0_CIOIN